MGKKKLLTKQQVLDAINRWVTEHGSPPTIEELRRALKVGSARTVLRYLRWLEDEGDIERWPGARGLKPLKGPRSGVETREVPIVGVTAAGPLMTAEQNIQGWVCLPKDFTKPPSARFFMLRVRGDSMNRARVDGGFIDDGDLVLVKQRLLAQSGEIVVALVDGEATIKRFVRAPGYFILKPESSNPNHKPIIVDKDFSIQGVVLRVLKKGSEMFQTSEPASL